MTEKDCKGLLCQRSSELRHLKLHPARRSVTPVSQNLLMMFSCLHLHRFLVLPLVPAPPLMQLLGNVCLHSLPSFSCQQPVNWFLRWTEWCMSAGADREIPAWLYWEKLSPLPSSTALRPVQNPSCSSWLLLGHHGRTGSLCQKADHTDYHTGRASLRLWCFAGLVVVCRRTKLPSEISLVINFALNHANLLL